MKFRSTTNLRVQRTRLYSLSRAQVMTLASGFAVTAAIIFFLGFLMGRRIEIRKKQSVTPEPAQLMPQALDSEKRPHRGTQTLVVDFRRAEVKEPARPAGGGEPKETPLAETSRAPENAFAETTKALWTVQVAAFRREKNAAAFAADLTAKGYRPRVAVQTGPREKWHRVLVGKLHVREDAKKLKRTLTREEGFKHAFVTRE